MQVWKFLFYLFVAIIDLRGKFVGQSQESSISQSIASMFSISVSISGSSCNVNFEITFYDLYLD